jgi:hypothetical protein
MPGSLPAQLVQMLLNQIDKLITDFWELHIETQQRRDEANRWRGKQANLKIKPKVKKASGRAFATGGVAQAPQSNGFLKRL